MANLSNINNKFLVTTGGNVGIGVTGPTAKLDIGGNTAGSLQAIFGRGNSDSNFTVRYTNGITGTNDTVQGTIGLDYANGYWADMAAVKFIRDSTAGELAFYTSATATSGVERMRIDSSGNVGIGTTSPNTKLVIGTTGGTQNIEISNSYIQSFNRSGSPGYQTLNFYASSYTFNVGNVGIGTTSPQRLLHLRSTNEATGIFLERSANYGFVQYNQVVGSVETYHLGFVNNNTFSSDILVANESGNVGIGTDSPQTKLEVNGGLVKIVENSNTAFYGGDYVRVFGTQSYGFRNSAGSAIAQISLTGNSYFNGGNVGIGITSPSQKLQVDGGAFGFNQGIPATSGATKMGC